MTDNNADYDEYDNEPKKSGSRLLAHWPLYTGLIGGVIILIILLSATY